VSLKPDRKTADKTAKINSDGRALCMTARPHMHDESLVTSWWSATWASLCLRRRGSSWPQTTSSCRRCLPERCCRWTWRRRAAWFHVRRSWRWRRLLLLLVRRNGGSQRRCHVPIDVTCRHDIDVAGPRMLPPGRLVRATLLVTASEVQRTPCRPTTVG